MTLCQGPECDTWVIKHICTKFFLNFCFSHKISLPEIEFPGDELNDLYDAFTAFFSMIVISLVSEFID